MPWPPPGPKHRGKLIAAASLVGALVIGAVVWLLVGRTDFDSIAESCDNVSDLSILFTITGAKDQLESVLEPDDEIWEMVPSFITVSPDGSSMSVDDRDFYSLDKVEVLSGLSGSTRDRAEETVDQWNGARDLSVLAAVSCIHDELDIPDSVENRMLSTRSLDGVQEASHHGTRITWSYHPARGLDVIYEKE